MKKLMYRLRFNAATHTALTIVTFLSLARLGFADVPVTPISISAERGAGTDAGPLITLRWDAVSNIVYKVQRRAGLEAVTPWETFDLITPTGPIGIFKLTPDKAEANSDSIRRSFFRLALPQAEIFSVEPALFAPGMPVELYVLGQCFASNDVVKFDGVAVPGGSVFFQDQSRLRVSLAAPSAGAHRLEVARAGAVVSAFDVMCADAMTAPDVALAEPPGEWPPGAPALMKAKEKGNRTKCSSNLRQIAMAAGGGGINEDLPGEWAQLAPAPLKVKEKANRSKRASIRSNSSDAGGEMRLGWGHSMAKGSIGNISARTAAPGGDTDEDCDDFTMNDWPGAFELMPFSAELRHQVVDMIIPGRGIDFVFARTYRSRTGADTSMGHGWTHSYDIRVEQVGADLALYDGTGRRIGLKVTASGAWVADGFFYEVASVNGRVKVKFPWLAEWEFNPFDSSASAGKISSSRDTSGNSITYFYGGSGRLTQIVDTLGHTNTLGYTSDGHIASLTDYTGRAVTYQYYPGGTAGGSIGDLRSVTMPPVTGTLNGNDFPDGKTTRYTYSIRFANDRLNHNLSSVIDPKGQNWLQIYYRTNLDAASFDFDAVDYLQRGPYRTHVRRYTQTPALSNQFTAILVIVKDGAGNVSECFYDSQNRCVRQLDYTGRANPDQPTTRSQNRPTGKVRASDPDFFETRWLWNVDSLCTRMTLPRGNEIQCIYERDFDRNASVRRKGDLRVQREVRVRGLSDPNLTDEYLTTRFDYDPRFGSPAIQCRMRTRINELEAHLPGLGLVGFAAGPRQTTSIDGSYGPSGLKRTTGQPKIIDNKKGLLISFAVSATDPRGNTTRASYNANGNCVRVTAPLAASLPNVAAVVDRAYNAFGQLVAITNAPDGNGRRSVDTFEYYTNPATPGYGYLQTCTRDNHLQSGVDVIQALRTAYEYDSLGHVTRCIDPRTNDWLFTYNALGQWVQSASAACCTGGRGGARYATQYTYDANDNLIRTEHENRDHTGALGTNPFWRTDFVYDSLNRMTGCWRDKNGNLVLRCQEVQFDANDNITLYRSPEAVNGNDPNAVVQYLYDERKLLFCVIQAPGTALAENKDVELDFNGNVTRVTRNASGGAKLTCALYEYDGFDRRVRGTDAIGNVDTYAYDANNNLTYHRFDGEANDVPGSAGNLRYHEWRWSYDALDRPASARASFFNIATQLPIGDGEAITTCAYAPNDLLLSVTDDNGHTTRYAYDGAHRLARVTDAKSNRVDYVYDKNGNVTTVTETERSDLGGADQVFVSTYSYDNLDRCVNSFNNVGNTEQYFYDSRGNLVRQIDANGNLTGWVYDGLSRCTLNVADLDGDGVLDFAADVGTAQIWDDNDRLISRMDDNGNTTTYTYDSLDRCVTIHNADSTEESLIWSPRSNLSSRTDANGTVTHYTYDLNDRLVRKDITPGAGVAATTTFEEFTYDGMSRIVSATNDVSMLDFSYDSLGSLEKAKQDCLATARTHDGVGNCLSMTYPGGRVVLSTYDELDRLAALDTLQCSGCIPERAASYSYDGPGRLSRIVRANGINTRINWNGLVNPANQTGDFGSRQVLRVNHARAGGTPVIDQRLFAYDRMQNKTARAQTASWVAGGPLITNAFAYNKLHRLTRGRKSTAAGLQQESLYQLDGNGNRQQVTANGVVQTYLMDATTPDPADFQMDQYTFTPFGNEQHDRNGNLLANTPMTPGAAPTYFAYDYANRLVQVSRLGSSGTLEPVVSFTYDALGRRISQTTYPGVPAVTLTTQFVHGTDLDSGAVIEERQNGKVTMSYVRPRCRAGSRHSEEDFASASPGGDCPDADPALVAFNGAGEALYYHTDDLGNVLALTDSKGNVLEHYDYDDYGLPSFYNSDGFPLMSNGQLATASLRGNRYLFHGMMWDAATGLYHDKGSSGVNPLYQDPKTGRYTGRNPQTGKAIKISAYSFASDNPWSASTGRWSWTGSEACAMNTGTVKFFNNAKGFGRMTGAGGGGDGSFLLKREEGGRHTPFHNKYRPQFYQRTTDVTGEIDLPQGRAKVIMDRDTGRSKGFSARGIFGKGKELTGHVTLVK